MQITLRADSVEIDGYVQSVERNSKKLFGRIGNFIERVCAGTFRKALNRADDVAILLNHDWDKRLGSIKQGNLTLEEDNIGLRAHATITDPEAVEAARTGHLTGWSFGFRDVDGGVEHGIEGGLPLRILHDLDLFEVSLLDDRVMRPAYAGTLVTVREEGKKSENFFTSEGNFAEKIEVRDENAEKPAETDEKGQETTEKTEKPAENAEKQSETQENGEVEDKHEQVAGNAQAGYNLARDIIKSIIDTLLYLPY